MTSIIPTNADLPYLCPSMGLQKIVNQIFIFPVRIYQWTLSPLLGRNCRFQPTCSHYMVEAIEEWGPLRGMFMGFKRIGRCHPWGGHGFDPVPTNSKKKLRNVAKTEKK